MNYHYIFVTARPITGDHEIPFIPHLCLFSETKVLNQGPRSIIDVLIPGECSIVVCYDEVSWNIIDRLDPRHYTGSQFREVWNQRFLKCIASIYDRQGYKPNLDNTSHAVHLAFMVDWKRNKKRSDIGVSVDYRGYLIDQFGEEAFE
jgi:hypothetical protein